jgi:hypothetical protein
MNNKKKNLIIEKQKQNCSKVLKQGLHIVMAKFPIPILYFIFYKSCIMILNFHFWQFPCDMILNRSDIIMICTFSFEKSDTQCLLMYCSKASGSSNNILGTSNLCVSDFSKLKVQIIIISDLFKIMSHGNCQKWKFKITIH